MENYENNISKLAHIKQVKSAKKKYICNTYLFIEVKKKLLSHVQLIVTPWTIYSSWNSLGQNIGLGSLSLLQGIFPTLGIEPGSPALQVDSLPTELPGKPYLTNI